MEEKKKTIDNFESAVKAQAEDLQKRKAAFREVAKTIG
jgi:hypothetical protein